MEEIVDILNDVKLVIDAAVILVERPGNGTNKKTKVLSIVKDFIAQSDMALPVPQAIFDYIVGVAIDWAVGWLNDNLWNKEKK